MAAAHAGILEVVRPRRDSEVQRQRQYVRVIWISTPHSASGFLEMALIFRSVDDSHRQGSKCEQDRIEPQPLLLGQNAEVLVHLVERKGGA
jgi:hypothetical protein